MNVDLNRIAVKAVQKHYSDLLDISLENMLAVLFIFVLISVYVGFMYFYKRAWKPIYTAPVLFGVILSCWPALLAFSAFQSYGTADERQATQKQAIENFDGCVEKGCMIRLPGAEEHSPRFGTKILTDGTGGRWFRHQVLSGEVPVSVIGVEGKDGSATVVLQAQHSNVWTTKPGVYTMKLSEFPFSILPPSKKS